MTRVLIYARQSVEKDEGDKSLSIDSQVATLRTRARKEGWTVVGEEREAGLRGWMDEADRPGLARCIARAAAGEYDILLVWDMSRLARSVRLQEDWIFRLARAGVDVISHTEPHASDEMIRVIFGAIHQRQTKITAANVRRALTERARRGHHHGRAPFGYERDPETKKLVPHPTRAAIVRELFERYAAGDTLSELTRDLSRRRVPTMFGGAWERTTVQTIITNPVYAGRVRFGDVVVEHAHPALVSQELWDRVQARKSSYDYTRYKDISSWLERRITHACGARMYLSSCGRRSPQPHFLCAKRNGYFPIDGDGEPRDKRCTVSPGRVRQSYAERQAWMLITRAVHEVRDEAAIIALLEQRHAERGPEVARERAELEHRLRDSQERRRRAENLYLDGRRDRTWFDAEDARLSGEIATIQDQLAGLPVEIDRDEVAARRARLIALASRVDDILPQHRGLILAELGTIVIGPGRNLNPSVHLRLDERIRPYFPDDDYT